ncbi:MAG: hypothetical protein ABJB85_12185, partial [Nitrososphaerota archaeon]
ISSTSIAANYISGICVNMESYNYKRSNRSILFKTSNIKSLPYEIRGTFFVCLSFKSTSILF